MCKRVSLVIGLIILFFAEQMATSCTGLSNKQGQDAVCDSCNDSLVMAQLEVNPRLVLKTVDSLEATGLVLPQRLYCYRALAYDKLDETQMEIEWGEKALEGDTLLLEDAALFYQVSDKLFTDLVNRGETEKALALAQRAYDESKKDVSADGMRWTAIFLHDIGYSEMQLGHIDEAESCFSQAYIALKQLAASNGDFSALLTCARVSYNIVDAYNCTGQYDKAAAWIESAEDAVEQMGASPECTQAVKNDYLGGLAVQKAMMLLEKGHRAEADRAYATAVELDYAKSNHGTLECATYLERAKRMDELMALMPRIDSLSTAWGNPASLEHWKQYQTKQNM